MALGEGYRMVTSLGSNVGGETNCEPVGWFEWQSLVRCYGSGPDGLDSDLLLCFRHSGAGRDVCFWNEYPGLLLVYFGFL